MPEIKKDSAFIEQQDCRFLGQRPGNQHALTLTRTEFIESSGSQRKRVGFSMASFTTWKSFLSSNW